MKHKRDREEACFTCGHYHDFEGGEPCQVCGHVIAGTDKKSGHESVMPTTVVPGFLYLGSYDTASRQELLKAMNISHILNTVPNCQALFKNTFTYHTVANQPPDFQECFTFLDSVNAQDKRVLVYCMSGVSRSPTVVIAYMMKLRGWRLAEAYKWVKDKRPQINISADDTKRLVDLEMQLHHSCSVPFGLAAVSLPGAFPTTQAQQQAAQQPQAQQQQAAQAQQQPSQPGAFQPIQWGSPAGNAPFTVGAQASAVPNFGGSSAPFVFGGSPAAAVAHQEQANDMEA